MSITNFINISHIPNWFLLTSSCGLSPIHWISTPLSHYINTFQHTCQILLHAKFKPEWHGASFFYLDDVSYMQQKVNITNKKDNRRYRTNVLLNSPEEQLVTVPVVFSSPIHALAKFQMLSIAQWRKDLATDTDKRWYNIKISDKNVSFVTSA